MSLTSKLVLGASCIGSGVIIIYVHYKQQYDRDQLRLGVIKDLERQNRRKIENTFILQQQIELAKALEKDVVNKSTNLEAVGQG